MTDRFQDIEDTAAYLNEHAKSNFANMPERSIACVLNRAPPSVREAIAVQYKGLEHAVETGGRIDHNGNPKPFAERNDSIYDDMPKNLKTTVDRMRTEELSTALMDRMGHEQHEQPVSRRDYLEAAFEGAENG